jgi:hypothetical protein
VYENQTSRTLEIKTSWWEHCFSRKPAEVANGAGKRLKDF